MNKHLKPGVAVDVRGASDEDVQAVIDACARLGLNMAKFDSGKGFIVLTASAGDFFECHFNCGLDVISISQALGRDSEVENTWVSGVECEASYAGKWYRAKFLSLHETNPHAYAVYLLDSAIDGLNLKWVTKLRPLKTEKDKFVEFALSLDCDPSEGMLSRHDYAARLYDKGLRFIDSKA